jgi:hypothetical protein
MTTWRTTYVGTYVAVVTSTAYVASSENLHCLRTRPWTIQEPGICATASHARAAALWLWLWGVVLWHTAWRLGTYMGTWGANMGRMMLVRLGPYFPS